MQELDRVRLCIYVCSCAPACICGIIHELRSTPSKPLSFHPSPTHPPPPTIPSVPCAARYQMLELMPSIRGRQLSAEVKWRKVCMSRVISLSDRMLRRAMAKDNILMHSLLNSSGRSCVLLSSASSTSWISSTVPVSSSSAPPAPELPPSCF